MNNIYEGIIELFDEDPDLSSRFIDGLYTELGDSNNKPPCALLTGIANNSKRATTCGGYIDDDLFQITVWETNLTKIVDAINEIMALFDHLDTEYNAFSIIMRRVSTELPKREDRAIWRASVTYQLIR